MAVTFGKLQLKKAEAGMLGFDFNGVYILDPTLDETARFTVDPIKYYGCLLYTSPSPRDS